VLCPRCNDTKSIVVDSRNAELTYSSDDLRVSQETIAGKWRRRVCVSCRFRFTTIEAIDYPDAIGRLKYEDGKLTHAGRGGHRRRKTLPKLQQSATPSTSGPIRRFRRRTYARLGCELCGESVRHACPATLEPTVPSMSPEEVAHGGYYFGSAHRKAGGALP